MIDQILIDSYIEVEEICLSRELTNFEKANVILNQISAEYKQVILLGDSPKTSFFELYYIDYKQFNKAFRKDYDLIIYGEFAVLFIYKIISERVYLYSNNGWKIGFDLPNKKEMLCIKK